MTSTAIALSRLLIGKTAEHASEKGVGSRSRPGDLCGMDRGWEPHLIIPQSAIPSFPLSHVEAKRQTRDTPSALEQSLHGLKRLRYTITVWACGYYTIVKLGSVIVKQDCMRWDGITRGALLRYDVIISLLCHLVKLEGRCLHDSSSLCWYQKDWALFCSRGPPEKDTGSVNLKPLIVYVP